jgi:hypothetical protein
MSTAKTMTVAERRAWEELARAAKKLRQVQSRVEARREREQGEAATAHANGQSGRRRK